MLIDKKGWKSEAQFIKLFFPKFMDFAANRFRDETL